MACSSRGTSAIRRRGDEAASTSHIVRRQQQSEVLKEVEAAGFVLDAESTMLANTNDAHSIKVFDPSIKGATDRFAYRFVKR